MLIQNRSHGINKIWSQKGDNPASTRTCTAVYTNMVLQRFFCFFRIAVNIVHGLNFYNSSISGYLVIITETFQQRLNSMDFICVMWKRMQFSRLPQYMYIVNKYQLKMVWNIGVSRINNNRPNKLLNSHPIMLEYWCTL